MENKKTLVLSIVGVLVLIIAVVGVSFAMYTFSATGTRENVIQTGTVSLNFSSPGSCSIAEYTDYEACEENGGVWSGPNTIMLTNEYPKSDAKGLEGTAVEFSVVATYTGTMTINYALQFVDITPGGSLTADKIKLQVVKTAGGTTTYPMGTASTGALLSSVSSANNTNPSLTDNVFDAGSFTTGGTITYTLKAWVDEGYTLSQGDNTGKCMNGDVEDTDSATAAACATARHTWVQTNASIAETLTFKIRVVAAQV